MNAQKVAKIAFIKHINLIYVRSCELLTFMNLCGMLSAEHTKGA